ncbi:alpha/beta-hydrolase [Byssothecium circinans]|uniref:Alpha/beta-hydrolase n=1 Tax=Byssothecium circinans TaxID=147558 RepID=A0A6A5TSQ4_9PLEO|nr:alpha/beta-hydrolase [Byssothecium circinans]
MSTVEEQQQTVRNTCRTYLSLPLVPISQLQAQSSGKRTAKGGAVIEQSNFPAPPENDLKNALFKVIEQLKSPEHEFMSSARISHIDVGVEFIRGKCTENRANYGDAAILYMHGRGLYFSSPAEYRVSTVRLARLTGAVVASTSYRLCPQNTFPAPILDVLLAYASLLYPSTTAAAGHGSLPPIAASRIVLAGNSAGANLAFGLAKFLLEFNKRSDPTILFHGQRVRLPLPGGIAVVSGWCDQTDCLPSWLNPNAIDILTPLQPALWPEFPADSIWPSNPPREHPYARAVNLDHELISPAAVRDWTGAPPIWFAVGELERGRDGNAVVASRAASCGVQVTWTEWQGMCHEYMIVTHGLPQASKTFMFWADACKRMIEQSEALQSPSTAVMYLMPDCNAVGIEGGVQDLMPLPFESVRLLMRIMNKKRPIWTGARSRKSSKETRL